MVVVVWWRWSAIFVSNLCSNLGGDEGEGEGGGDEGGGGEGSDEGGGEKGSD